MWTYLNTEVSHSFSHSHICREKVISALDSCTIKKKSESSLPLTLNLTTPSHPLQLTGSSWFWVDYLQIPYINSFLSLLWLAFNFTNSIEKQAIIEVEGLRDFFLMSWYVPSQLNTGCMENRGSYQAMYFCSEGGDKMSQNPFPFWRQQECARSF